MGQSMGGITIVARAVLSAATIAAVTKELT
jgi:hypothetical protein